MAQKVLNEAQMREYVEQEVIKTLMNESLDEGIGGDIMNWIMGKIMGSGRFLQAVSNYMKQNMRVEDLLALAVHTFGASAIINMICKALGIEANGILGQTIKAGLAAVIGSVTSGMKGGNAPEPSGTPGPVGPLGGNGGSTSPGGGGGYAGGAVGGGSR